MRLNFSTFFSYTVLRLAPFGALPCQLNGLARRYRLHGGEQHFEGFQVVAAGGPHRFPSLDGIGEGLPDIFFGGLWGDHPWWFLVGVGLESL